MQDAVMPSPVTQPKSMSRFAFQKDHGSLFVLYLKSMLLSVITLGIYFFWARVAITKYLYNHTTFGQQSFDYHATGKEMFIGFLKGIVIIAVIALIYVGLALILPKAVVAVTMYLGIGLFGIPFLLIGNWRFMLSRSSWCSVRFSNSGDYNSLSKIWLKGALLSVVTLGFYVFVLQNQIQSYFLSRSRFGRLQFSYTGDSKEYFWLNIKGILLTIITLGIYTFWYAASLNRYIFSHMSIDGHKMDSTITGGALFGLAITNLLIVICTLGFGFPIAVNRMYGYLFENVSLDASADDLRTTAGETDTGASAFAQGIEQAADAIDALSGII